MKKKKQIKFLVIKKITKLVILLFIFNFVVSCEDIFLRFKYETYECGKNFFFLKKIFIKNYEIGDQVDVEVDDGGYKLEIIENNNDSIVISRKDPDILIKIEKKTEKLNINFNNHIQNLKCKKHIFKM